MDNTREKLIELICEVQYQGNAVHGYSDRYIQNGELADHLIAHGVTLQDHDCHWATEIAYKNGYEAGKKDALKQFAVTSEKLVELLNKANAECVGTDCFEGCKFYAENDCLYKLMADVLIANGVTIATDNNVGDKLTPAAYNLSPTEPLTNCQQWIPVSERLPDEDGWHLVFTTPNRGYRSINKGQFIKGYEWDNFKPRWRGAGGTWTNVTHWMPLPEPPKGE